jgi:hypothetical protein
MRGIAGARKKIGVYFSPRRNRRRGTRRQIRAARFGSEFSTRRNFCCARCREKPHAAAADFHLGSLWQERQAGVRRGRRPAHRAARTIALELRLLEAHGRISCARLCARKKPARHHRAAVQHRRAQNKPDVTEWCCRASSRGSERKRAAQSFGDGKQTRCFCLVNDVVEALVRLQDCNKARGEIFNIGGTEEFPCSNSRSSW